MSDSNPRELDTGLDSQQLWKVLKVVFVVACLGYLVWTHYSFEGGPEVREMFRIEMLISERHYDKAIEATTRKIKETPTWEWAWTTRGEAYRRKGDLDHAFADFDEAIRLKPESKDARYNRCLAFRDKGDLERAYADCQEAARIKPDLQTREALAALELGRGDAERAYESLGALIALQGDNAPPAARFHRGRLALFVLDRPAEAADDLVKAAASALSRYSADIELAAYWPAAADTGRNPIELPFTWKSDGRYLLLWNHIARVRAGQNDAPELADHMDKLQAPFWRQLFPMENVNAEAERKALAPWPGAIFALYLGKSTPEAVRAAAEQESDPALRAKRMCDADFYIGEYQLEKGAGDEARRLFRSAADNCPASAREAAFARFELKRLGAPQ
jgi:tetratricopeptide (TPR) repeat protein